MTIAIVGLLIAVTAGAMLFRRVLPASLSAEVQVRLKSWWIMVGLFIAAATIDWRVTIVCCAIMSVFALREFYALVQLREADRGAMLLAYVAVIVQYWWVYQQWYIMFLIFIPIYMFLVIPFRLVLSAATQQFMSSAGKLQWGLMAFVFGLSHLAYLLVMELDEATAHAMDNRGLLFYVVFLAEFNDVLQYVFGKSFGRHKMTPSISPNKTWEGFLGGLVCTSALAVAIRFLTPMDWRFALGAGILIATTGPVGGMIISAIKRDVGVKDSGTLIPGHGGILDRVDSLCFSAPVFFHYVGYFY